MCLLSGVEFGVTVSFEAGEAGCSESMSGERCWRRGSPFAGFGAQVWALFAELCTLPSLGGAAVGLGDVELLLPGHPGTQGFGSR